MKRSIAWLSVALAILIGRNHASAAGPPFELRDGDRVVLIGGTMIEREQESGYLETRLTRRYPDRSITFRNLGWSGDTVEGISQAGFGSVEDGYKHLVNHVLALKPTVVILGYGANEAFEGQAGLAKFLKGLDRLLKAIEPTKARLVFLSPTRQENLGPPLPDPTTHNADLALYRDALKVEAEKRDAVFVNLFDLLPDGTKANPHRSLTTNGLHFTLYGYWRLAAAVEEALFLGPKPPDPNEPPEALLLMSQEAAEFSKIPGGIRMKQLRPKMLPAPSPPEGGPPLPGDGLLTRISGLSAGGRYVLKAEGRTVAFGDADERMPAVFITALQGPEFDQVEALRQVIVAKNQLYFYRWRPQNETYLFGFRKHEQGQNAREIPQFDPLIAAKEAEIAKFRVPGAHTYELIREGEVGK